LRFPAGSENLRLETGYRQGDRISQYYDALIAKLVAWGETRESALTRLRSALAQTQIAGVACNRDLLQRILAHPDFAAHGGDTGFIARHHATLLAQEPRPEALAAAALYLIDEIPRPSLDAHSPWAQRDSWRIGGTASQVFRFRAGDETHEVRI